MAEVSSWDFWGLGGEEQPLEVVAYLLLQPVDFLFHISNEQYLPLSTVLCFDFTEN